MNTKKTLVAGALIFFFYLSCVVTPSHGFYVKVVSTSCTKTSKSGRLEWITCPDDADAKRPGKPSSQFKPFCCGSKTNRHCCDMDDKLQEHPGFNPEALINDDDFIYHDFRKPNRFGWWKFIFAFALAITIIGLTMYFCGCVIVQMMEMICHFCCCCFKKKKNRYQDQDKSGVRMGSDRRPPMKSEGRRLEAQPVLVCHHSSASVPPNYHTILPRDQVGGTPDLYQNLSATAAPAYDRLNAEQHPPSYEQAADATPKTDDVKM